MGAPDHLENTAAVFGTTHWSLVDALDGVGPPAADARSELARIYWPAVYAYYRRRGIGKEAAAEMTQGFFCDVIEARGLFESADQSRGRLRGLVCAAARNYAIDRHRADRPSKGGLRLDESALTDAEASLDDDPSLSAERAFDRAWGVARLREALRRCEAHFVRSGKAAHWHAFEARHLTPAIGNAQPPQMVDLALELGFDKPGDVASAVQVVRKRLVAVLQELTAGEGEQDDSASTASLLGL